MNNTSAVVFVDLLLGNVSLPIFTYHVGFEFRLWTRWIWTEKTNKPLYTFLVIFDTFSRRPRLLLPRSYPVRHLTSYIGRWSIDHYQNDYTELLFLQCGYSLSLSLPPGLHQISFSPTPCSFGDHIICYPRLYEDDIYLKSNLFLVNNNMVTDHFHFKRQKHVLVLV